MKNRTDQNRPSLSEKELYLRLSAFIEQINAPPDYTDEEPSLAEHLFSLLDEVLGIGEQGLRYSLIYNTSEDERFSIVDLRCDESERGMLKAFIREASLSFLYNMEPARIDAESMASLESLYRPKALFSLPMIENGNLFGYVLLLDNESAERLDCIPERILSFTHTLLSVAALSLQKKFYEKRMEYLALNDNMTGLPNRTYFNEAMVSAIQEATLLNTSFVLLIVNINGLKHINNSLGLYVGDMLLAEVASRLKNAFRDMPAVTGRLSGDDFAILVQLPEYEIDEAIQSYCQQILEQTKEPIRIEDYRLYITVSIGASVFPEHGDTTEMLQKKADEAKISARRVGNNSYVVYEDIMSTATQKSLFLNNNLPQAIENDQFELFYQGQADIHTGKVQSAEALIRWRHPTRGIIPPFEFIPYAEENNYFRQIDTIVLQKACAQMQAWQAEGRDLTISVNISAKHFRNGVILNTLGRVLSEYEDVSPSKLKIELLESTVLDDFDMTVMVIRELKNLGVTVALDDFGAGYSSLEYITNLPIDIIKIDRYFTMNLYENPNNKIILKTIVTLAKDMRLQVLAEGVETKPQWDFLASIGCDIAQGYYINKPVPVVEFETIMEDCNSNNTLLRGRDA